MRQTGRRFTKNVNALAPYEDHIVKRWQQGCRNATRTWREVSEQGYPGAYQNAVRITRYLKEQGSPGEPYRIVRRVSPLGKQPGSR
jgi:hypothetical protein